MFPAFSVYLHDDSCHLFFCVVLRVELRALCRLGKHSTTEFILPSPSSIPSFLPPFLIEMGSLLFMLVLNSWAQVILLCQPSE